jgi:mono/diheme cytochrome c family protein/Cu/Ag efflux protein CusF
MDEMSMKILLVLLTLSLACSTGTQSKTQIDAPATDRERDGLSGPVKAVLTDYVAFGEKDGRWSETQQVSSTTIYDAAGARTVQTPFKLDTPGGYAIVGYDPMYNREAQGRTVEEQRPLFEGSSTGKWVKTWNARGRLSEKASYTAQGVLAEKLAVSYEDDTQGNWIKRVVTPAAEAGQGAPRPVEVSYRLIVYYKPAANASASSAARSAPAEARVSKSPLAASEKDISAGQILYSQRCAACHGMSGKADTEIAKALDIKPADLTSEKSRKLTDGDIWWVITHGIEPSRMPALKDRIGENERWQIVLFVRALQGNYPLPPPLGRPAEAQAPPPQRAAATRQTPAVPAAPQRYNLRGKIVSVDRKLQVATVEHQAIEGYMEAMTMPFPLKDARMSETLKPGDLIEATLVVAAAGGQWWLEKVIIIDKK